MMGWEAGANGISISRILRLLTSGMLPRSYSDSGSALQDAPEGVASPGSDSYNI